MRNNRGPSTDPWGTPDSIGRYSEKEPFINVMLNATSAVEKDILVNIVAQVIKEFQQIVIS